MRSSCVPLLQCESELIPGRIPVAFEWVFTPPDSINQSIHLYLDLCVCDHIMKTYYIHNVFPCNSGPFFTEFTRAARDGLEGVHTPPPIAVKVIAQIPTSQEHMRSPPPIAGPSLFPFIVSIPLSSFPRSCVVSWQCHGTVSYRGCCDPWILFHFP